MTTADIDNYLLQMLGRALARHVEPLFKPGVKITLAIRLPGNNEADVLVSSEADLQEVIDMVERSKAREEVKP